MLIAQSTLSHVRQLDSAFRACIHEPVTADGVEFGSGDDFCELLHVGWFDVDNVEALVLDVQVPEIDPQIIAADKGFSVTVDGYAVDMIGVCVCISLSRYRGDNGVMMC